MEDLMADRWATNPRSMTSCSEDAASMANPVWRTAITSWWSPKIESACAARARAETCSTPGNSSPDILYMLGTINSNPCDAVKVDVKAPAARDPCTDAAAPASD